MLKPMCWVNLLLVLLICHYFPDYIAAYLNLPTQVQKDVDNSSANKLPGNIVFEFDVFDFVFNFLIAASVHIASWNQMHVHTYDYVYI